MTLLANYWLASGAYNGKTVADVSRQYDTLFTPANFTFSIWGVIYALLIAYVGFQWYQVGSGKQEPELKKEGGWFIVSNVANMCWIFVWINELVGLSVVMMIILLVALVQLTLRLNLERWDAPVRIIAFVWWPICVYFGWIILATVANVSALLVRTGWSGNPLSPETWTVVMIIVAMLIYLVLILKRSMREASIVGMWGLAGIAYRQWADHREIAYVAIGAGIVLMITVAYQAFKNIQTNPFLKMKRGEF